MKNSYSSRSTFLFNCWGRNEGLESVEMYLNLYNGTITTHATLQVSQSLFGLVVREISARVDITIQSVAAAGYRAYELNCSGSFEDSHLENWWFSIPSWKIYKNILPHKNCTRQLTVVLKFQIFYLKLPTSCRKEKRLYFHQTNARARLSLRIMVTRDQTQPESGKEVVANYVLIHYWYNAYHKSSFKLKESRRLLNWFLPLTVPHILHVLALSSPGFFGSSQPGGAS